LIGLVECLITLPRSLGRSVFRSVTDAGGNTANDSFDVIVTDIGVPTVSLPTTTVPADLSAVPAVDAAGAVVTYSGESASDVVDGALTPICAPASGSIFPLGTTTVTCSATDAGGNTGSASFDVTVVDVTAPVVTVPADIFGVPASDPTGAVVNYSGQSALDNVDGPLAPVCTPAAGSLFPLGATTVTCTATDAAGNTGSASFTVTVTDAAPPVVFVPADITAEADRADGRIVDYAVSALDAVDGALPVACTPLGPGAVFPVGATLVTCACPIDPTWRPRTVRVVVVASSAEFVKEILQIQGELVGAHRCAPR